MTIENPTPLPAASCPVLPLNDFQRLIRRWEEFQPFLGIDAIEANGPVDAGKLRAAAEEELAILGIGLPIASADGRRVTYRPGRPAIPVETIQPPEGTPALNALADQCSRELNRRFQPDIDPLIRVWVVQTTPNPHIGMTWQHWPMDGVSAGDLFRRILARYVGCPVGDSATATDLVVPDLNAIFRPWQTWRREATNLNEAVHESFYFSRVYAVPRPHPEQTSLRVHLLDLQHPARPQGATANDVVAAALTWAIADAIPERQRNWWRQRINLINFIDLRSHVGEALQRVWGMFLAFSILHMPEPRPAQWETLIASLRDQSLRVRDGQLFFGSLGAFAILRRIFACLPRRWCWSLPYSLTPFSAALTNTRFRGDWTADPFGAHFGRSWRIAPLGPMAPLTADVCTKGDQLSLALTCEDPSVMSERIEAIKATMRGLLEKK